MAKSKRDQSPRKRVVKPRTDTPDETMVDVSAPPEASPLPSNVPTAGSVVINQPPSVAASHLVAALQLVAASHPVAASQLVAALQPVVAPQPVAALKQDAAPQPEATPKVATPQPEATPKAAAPASEPTPPRKAKKQETPAPTQGAAEMLLANTTMMLSMMNQSRQGNNWTCFIICIVVIQWMVLGALIAAYCFGVFPFSRPVTGSTSLEQIVVGQGITTFTNKIGEYVMTLVSPKEVMDRSKQGYGFESEVTKVQPYITPEKLDIDIKKAENIVISNMEDIGAVMSVMSDETCDKPPEPVKEKPKKRIFVVSVGPAVDM